MTITVTVYQKDGLCRGPAIYDATFRAVATQSTSIGLYDIPLAATLSPLSGTEPTYTVASPGLKEWYLRVASPKHCPWDFFVRDGETHSVWLTPD